MRMTQQTFAMADDQNAQYRKPTKCDVFLAAMKRIVSWAERCSVIEPHYPKPETAGHPWAWSACCGSTSCSTDSTHPPIEEGFI